MKKARRTAVALGSNRGDRLGSLRLATEKLKHLADPEAPFLTSAIYETAPVDCAPGAASFLNAVVEFETLEKPEVLLQRLHGIERFLGRVRQNGSGQQHTSRTLDLDILYCGDLVSTSDPQLPHPRWAQRAFVLAPLNDVAPNHTPPGADGTVQEIFAALTQQEAIRRMDERLDDPLEARKFQATLIRNRKGGPALTALTAYDYPGARLLDESDVDILLVGDSVGMVVLGYPDTTRVTLPDIVHHLKAARRGVARAMLVADLPFETYRTPEEAVSSALELLEAGADAIKLEGATEMAPQISMLADHDIPVMAHIGMLPQHILEEGGYKIKGRTPEEADRLIEGALAVQEAGAFAVVLEIVEPVAAGRIRSALSIPTIGIGSGPDCDGQILVTHDLVGLYPWFTPPFAKPEAALSLDFQKAVDAFVRRTRGDT